MKYDKFLTPISAGDFNRVKKMVENGYDFHKNNEEALCLAIKTDKTDIAEYLINKGANIHAMNEKPLFLSIEKYNNFIVKLLLEKGANFHIASESILLHAAILKNMIAFNFLIEKGANLNEALMNASRHCPKYNEAVKLLLEKGADVQCNANNPLMTAAYRENDELFTYLLEKGANLNEALKSAVKIGLDNAIKYMIEKGATPDEITLKIATEKNDETIINLLKVDTTEKEKVVVMENLEALNEKLLEAVRSGRCKKVIELVEQGADIHYKQDYLLREAAKKGYTKLVKYFVNNGLKVESYNFYALRIAEEEEAKKTSIGEIGIDPEEVEEYVICQRTTYGGAFKAVYRFAEPINEDQFKEYLELNSHKTVAKPCYGPYSPEKVRIESFENGVKWVYEWVGEWAD